MKTQLSYQQIDYRQRETIAIARQNGSSIRAIARMLDRAPSTISRELARNQPGPHYNCHFAQQRRDRRRAQGRPAPKLAAGTALFEVIAQRLRLRWSPRQIAGYLAKQYPSDASMRISHESIYAIIYALPRGELRRELVACLRMARAKRWPRSRGKDRRGQIADLTSIHVRPPEVADRLVPGHWEGDLIKGTGNASAVGTLVERTTRLVILVKLPHPNPASAAHVLQAFTDKLRSVAQPMRLSLTYDRGKEMAYHLQLTANTAMAVYFCDPHSPWQRGSNENMNGLVRQYLPKGSDLSGYSQEQLDAIANEINGRPRKTLDWACPLDVYSARLARLDAQPDAIQ